jgi:hypothetical protein
MTRVERGPRHDWSSRDRWIALAFAIGSIAIFLASPRVQILDARYTILISNELLERGSIALDRHVASLGMQRDDGSASGRLPYQFSEHETRVYPYFPLGTALLSLPFVAAGRGVGISVVRSDGSYERLVEKGFQRVIAALAMGALVSGSYAVARLLLGVAASAGVASALALSTQVWSTASRALWSHTFLILLVGIALGILLRAELRGARIRPALLGTLLGWAWWVRPTAVIAAACVAAILAPRRREFVWFAAAFLTWASVLLVVSSTTYGTWLPPYYAANRLELDGLWDRVAGVLVSPGRGLLIYVPLAAFVVGWAAFHARDLCPRRFAAAAAAAIAMHVGLVATFPHWWGGHGYGARLLTDAVPWLGVLGILAWSAHDRWLEGLPERRRALTRNVFLASAAVLAVAGAFMNGVGAISDGAARWNVDPVDVDARPERLWDWSDPPFTRILEADRR